MKEHRILLCILVGLILFILIVISFKLDNMKQALENIHKEYTLEDSLQDSMDEWDELFKEYDDNCQSKEK